MGRNKRSTENVLKDRIYTEIRTERIISFISSLEIFIDSTVPIHARITAQVTSQTQKTGPGISNHSPTV